MFRLFLMTILVLFFNACGGGSTSSFQEHSDSNKTLPPTSTHSGSGKSVFITQDTWDRDNYSLIRGARLLEDAGSINVLGITTVMGGNCEADYFASLYGNFNKIAIVRDVPKRPAPTCSEYAKFFPNVEHHTYPDVVNFFINKVSHVRDNSVYYVAGGGYAALAKLISTKRTLDLINEKVKIIILVGSFDGGGDANENSDGGWAVKTVINNLSKIRPPVVFAWGEGPTLWFRNDIIKDNTLRAILSHGPYWDKNPGFHTAGDLDLLNYVVQNSLSYKPTRLIAHDDGSVEAIDGEPNGFIMMNGTSDFINWYKSLGL